MNEDIIRMAREAGAWSQQKKNCEVDYVMSVETVKHFAALVAAAEREACAKAVEAEAHMFATLAAAKSLADGIRARSER